MTRRRGVLALGSVLLVVGALVAVREQLLGAGVRTSPVRRATIVQTVLVSGRVLPPAEIDLVARLEASVVEVLVSEGERVRAGDVLARLDEKEAQADVARARAATARAQAASGRSRRIAPQMAEQRLSSVRTELAEAQRTLEQAQILVGSGAWPADRLAMAKEGVALAKSAEQSASLELNAARGADRKAADATVDEALAALALAEQRLAQTRVIAPVDGIILERSVDRGDTPRAGSRLFLLAADGPPILSVNPDERHLSELAIGQRATASADAYADRPFEARVSFIAPAVDPDRGTVEVRLLSAESVPFLRANMTLSVEIEVAERQSALVVEASQVHDAASGSPWVGIAVDGRVARRVVKLGLRGDETIEILEGLREGDVVLDGFDRRVREGDRVRVAD